MDLIFVSYRTPVYIVNGAGGNREGLNYQQIRAFVIPLPSVYEQEKIADILSATDEKIEVLEEKKKVYRDIKKGLMQQLLTGKIRVNNFIKVEEYV